MICRFNMEDKTKIFIEKAKKVHGDKYDYSLVNYISSKKKVNIICPVHGLFEQIPYSHLKGMSCRKCANDEQRKRLTLNTGEFIKKAIEKHGDKYDYSLVDYKDCMTKVKIICPTHGTFEQSPYKHTNGQGCRECSVETTANKSRLTSEEIISRFKKAHGDKYNYSLVDYKRIKEKVKIICPVHGVFEQQVYDHSRGFGCDKCSGTYSYDTEEFIKLATLKHSNRYNYSLVKYNKAHNHVDIICPKHGVFSQKAYMHLQGHGCDKCADTRNGLKRRYGTSLFVEKANVVHNNKYDYSKSNYETSRTKLEIICPKHGSFWQIPNSHLQGQGCPKCINPVSKPEQELFDFLSGYVTCEQSNRELLKPSEIDIFIPSLNIAIEYNGLYWHSDKIVGANYHLDKLNNCNNKGVRLFHLFDDEWRDKKDIVKSRLLNLIGKTPNKIYARKCEIREVDSKTASKFLDENHIQGKLGSKVKLGLYFKNELVSLMTFGELRKNLGQTAKEGSYELLRFCNKLNTNVVGGASKLLKHFEKTYQPKEIISYADRRWSDGNLYKQLGFVLISVSQPNYFYTKGDVRENRFKYRKSELVKQGFDPNKTEKQIMEEEGFVRVYDCGTLKFVKTFGN